jgi:hypothetical protein
MQKLNWRQLNHILNTKTEDEVLAMLEAEKVGECRISVLERLHQRYNSLRVMRERIHLIGSARNV